MGSEEETVRLVTDLDRGAVESMMAQVRAQALSNNLPPLATLLSGVEGMRRAQMAARVLAALKWLEDKPEHRRMLAQLELVELNLKNL